MFEIGDIVKVVYPRVRDKPEILDTIHVICDHNGTGHRFTLYGLESRKRTAWWDIENLQLVNSVRERVGSK